MRGQDVISACCDPKFNGGNEHRALVGLPQKLQHRRDRVATGLDATELADRALCPLLSEMLDRRDDQIFFGPEVVNLRASSDARELSDSRRRRPRVAVGDQALDGGVKQPGAHGGSALRLGPPHTLSVDFCRH